MGCTNSKLDDERAVALCKERCTFLDVAIGQRFALAEAHVAYIQSLKQIGHSLHHFIEQDSKGGVGPHRKGVVFDTVVDVKGQDVNVKLKPSTTHLPSHSNSGSGSHLQFDSDSDDDDDRLSDSLHSSPLHDYPDHNNYQQALDSSSYSSFGGGGGGGFHMNYMKSNKTTPSVVFQQRPISPDHTVHHMNNNNNNNYPYPYPYQGYPNQDFSGGSSNYYYGSSSSPPRIPSQAMASTSKPPPPPPSPPREWGFGFMNLFESYEKNYYNSYTPSRDSKEVRDEEGIPDLEEEDYYRQEVVKQVDFENNKHLNADVDVDDKINEGGYRQSGVSMENDGLEYEVHVVDKKVVDDEREEERSNAAGAAATGFKPRSRDVSDVANEIHAQFVRASDSLNEVATMLEAGKLPYQRKHGIKF